MYPNNEQKILIEKSFGCSRYIYNYFLNLSKEKTSIKAYDYIKELHKIMLAIPESTKISDIPLYSHTKWKVVKLINNIKKYMLYFNLSVSMYPELQGMVRPQSSNNNRPVYEPWLIWGVFKFIWLHRIENDDDMEIDVFDLSPTYEN